MTSNGHIGYSWTIEGGVVEVIDTGASIVRSPLDNPLQSDGARHGREWWPSGDRYAPLWRPMTFETVEAARQSMTESGR